MDASGTHGWGVCVLKYIYLTQPKMLKYNTKAAAWTK